MGTGSAEITVTSLPLKGKVRGPASVGTAGSISLKTTLVDPDFADDTPSYQWNVFDSNGDGVLYNGLPVSLGSSATATITGSKLTAGTYSVEVIITKGARSITATMPVTVVAGSPPAVTTEAPAEAQNPSDKVKIPAGINSASS